MGHDVSGVGNGGKPSELNAILNDLGMDGNGQKIQPKAQLQDPVSVSSFVSQAPSPSVFQRVKGVVLALCSFIGSFFQRREAVQKERVEEQQHVEEQVDVVFSEEHANIMTLVNKGFSCEQVAMKLDLDFDEVAAVFGQLGLDLE